jgi:tRNA 2-thiouridine synthesizing protein A
MSTRGDGYWDAGDMGCGELVLQLRNRMKALPSGSVLELRANDPGAVADIPAWCGMTGHVLVRQEHPLYWIQRMGANDAR